ncbi:MAG: co-chaperone GroES [Patescibacteria group bacterium]
MTVKPLLDNILIEPLERERQTASGIVIPDSAKEKPQEGKVVATGPGKPNDAGVFIKPQVKVGDTVIYKKWGGNEIKIAGKDYLIVKEEDILATL